VPNAIENPVDIVGGVDLGNDNAIDVVGRELREVAKSASCGLRERTTTPKSSSVRPVVRELTRTNSSL
jgi:hypothetical protein